jgi:hypothetical protein
MELRPVTRYAPPSYPQDGALGEAELAQALPRRWRRKSQVVAALMACLALPGCGSSVPQAAADAVDRAAVALHLKQPPPARLMGMVMAPPAPIPTTPPVVKPAEPAAKRAPTSHAQSKWGARR